MSLAQGQVLQTRYRIAKLIGQGGYGAVYRAWDLRLNRACALKENLDGSDEAKRQFGREAEVLAKIHHPNLPRVIDHFSIQGEGQFLVMDFIEGEDLQSKIERAGVLPETQVLDWVEQICDALSYLHTQSPPLIHRDIKPANIKITPEGRAVLVDFGIVKIYDPALRTTIGARAVTPGYSPFEQYGQGATDSRTDVYALGATMYTLLTGQEPPESILRLAGTPMPEISSKLNGNTKRAILTAMAMMPNDRHQSISEFRNALLATTSGSVQAQQAAAHSKTYTRYEWPNPAGIEWVEIPSGAFLYGQKKEHTFLRNAYRIGKCPVTNAQYKCFLDANLEYHVPENWDNVKRQSPPDQDRYPVVYISWDDATDFCRWAKCRLPTEKEWEKAARGHDGRSYPWGEDWQRGKYCADGKPSPVGEFPDGASPYGILDAAGNVKEWTWGLSKDEFYKVLQVLRGGGSTRESARAVNHYHCPPSYRNFDSGFRCVQDIW